MAAGPDRRPLDGFATITMVVLCAVWGAQQVAIKLAARDLAPLVQVALRCGISALLVGALAAWRGDAGAAPARGERADRRGPRRAASRPGLLAGVLFAAEFLLIAEGLRFTTASHMAVFLYTAPVFTALGLHALVPSERLGARQWVGVAIAFAGIAVAFGGRSLGAHPIAGMLLGDALGVLAGASWGATTVVVRSSALSEAPPALTLLYQLAAGFALLLPAAALSGEMRGASMTATAWASLLFQGIVVSFASYLTWFWLLRRYLATRLSVLSFMTPLFGVAFGVLFLHESIDAAFGTGAALVVAGIVVVGAPGRLRRALAEPASAEAADARDAPAPRAGVR